MSDQQDGPGARTARPDLVGSGRAPGSQPAAGAAGTAPSGAGPSGASSDSAMSDSAGSGSAGSGSAGSGSAGSDAATTVLPEGVRRPPARPATRPGGVTARPASEAGRPTAPRTARAADARPAAKTRRARLAIQRIDPWSVFLYSLVSSVFLGIALVVAVGALYAVLDALGVLDTVNALFVELTGGSATATPLFTSGRFLGAAAVLAAVNVVFLTLFSTLGSLLYNLCASFTGGIEVTLGERD